MEWSNLFPQVLNMSLTASVAILVIYLARLLLKKAPTVISYLLWAVVLLRLLCPFSVSSDLSLMPQKVSSGEVVSEWSQQYVSEVDIIREDSVYYEPAVAAGREPMMNSFGYYVVTNHDQLSEPQTVSNTLMPVLSIIWISGVAVFVFYSAVSYFRLKRRLTGSVKLKDNIYGSDYISSPFVLGILRPKIYLPSSLTEQERGYIILHEQHHIKRCDHIIKIVAFAALAVHWFNPLVWLAFILFCKDMEMSCDEAVIKKMGPGIKADYSASLLSLATGRRIVAGVPLAFGEGNTGDRIKNLAKWKKPAFGVVIVAAVACAVLAVCLLTDQRDENEGNGTYLYLHSYGVVEVTYSSPALSLELTPGLDTPYFHITEHNDLLRKEEANTNKAWVNLGTLQELELDKHNFDALFSSNSGQGWWMKESANAIRQGNARAWQLIYNNDTLYYVLQQKNGEIYLAHGYYDASEKNDPYSDDTSIHWLFKLAVHVYEDTGAVAIAGENVVPLVGCSAGENIAQIKDSLFWLDISGNPGDKNFRFLCDGKDLPGQYTIYDAETFEQVEYSQVYGIEDLKYHYNIEYERNYIISLVTDPNDDGIGDDRYCVGAIFHRSPYVYPDNIALEGDQLTLNDVIELSFEGDDLGWDDFADFAYLETGSGLYIRHYPIDEMFSLYIGGTGTNNPPMYIYLHASDSWDLQIDIRDGEVEEFIDEHINNPVVKSIGYSYFCAPVGSNEDNFSAMIRLSGVPDEMAFSSIRTLPVVRINTPEQLQNFVDSMQSTLDMDRSYADTMSLHQVLEMYDEQFFAQGHTLVFLYVEEGTTAHRHMVEYARKSEGELSIGIMSIEPKAGDSAREGWIIAIAIANEDLRDVSDIEARISSVHYPDRGIASASLLRTYVFTESDELFKPAVMLYDNGWFSFQFSALSSYFGTGEYIWEDDRLTLNTDDGKFTYVFDMQDDKLIFDAESSSDTLWFSNIYDGAVFE